MPFPIPNTDELDWSIPLKNHLGQLNDPDTGGFNTVNSIQERDTVYWPNGDTNHSDYDNFTVYIKSNGSFYIWNASSKVWIALQKNVSNSEWNIGSGTLTSDGLFIFRSNNNVDFTTLTINKGDNIKLTDFFGQPSIYTIKNIYTDRLEVYEVISYRNITNATWIPGTRITANLVVSGTTGTFSVDPSTFGGVEVGDSIYLHSASENYSTQFYTKVVSVNGFAITLEETTTGYSYSGFWALRKKFKISNYEIGLAIHRWEENDKYALVDRTGTIVTNGAINIKNIDKDSLDTQFYATPISFGIAGRGNHNGFYSHFQMNINTNNPVAWPVETGGDIISHFRYEEPDKWTIFASNNENKIGFLFATAINTSPYKSQNRCILVLEQTKAGFMINNPSERVHVSGNIIATGTITPGSDIRWKTDISPVYNALEKLSLLNGVTYNWNLEEQESRGTDKQIGLIAQDVFKVCREAVKLDNEGYMHLNYDGLGALYVEAIKELNQKIAVQETRINELELILKQQGLIINELKEQVKK
jgi:hypothetical protein